MAAFEHTANECEKAARGIERATLVFQLDVPHALRSVERAGNEIESLGRMFNVLGGSKKKDKTVKSNANRNSSVPRPGEVAEPELHGRYGMQRAVQDMSAMTLVGLKYLLAQHLCRSQAMRDLYLLALACTPMAARHDCMQACSDCINASATLNMSASTLNCKVCLQGLSNISVWWLSS